MTISHQLNELGLILGPKTCAKFDELYEDILNVPIRSYSSFFKDLWPRYRNKYDNKVMNGNIFEGLLAVIFFRAGILPLFVEAKLTFVPNISFDFVAYSEEFGPILLSAKTSLKERYKQADLEGMMLKQVHRRSKSYLVTISQNEANLVNKKISKGLVLGLDKAIIATDDSLDQLIAELQKFTFYEPNKIDVLVAKKIVK